MEEGMGRQALILLGGKGTRLSALFPDVPKALAPVAGRPFMEWQFDWLRGNGFTDVHLAAGHLADVLAAWLRQHPPEGLRVTMSVEPKPLGTGGAIRFAGDFLTGERFFVLNGDSLAPRLDFGTLEARFLKSSKAWNFPEKEFQGLELPGKKVPGSGSFAGRATGAIGVVQIERTGRYGTVEFDLDGRVGAFLEKADRESGWINTGVYVLDRAVLEDIPADVFVSIETDVFPRLCEEGRLLAVPCPPPLLDMGTPDGLEAMERHLAGGSASLCGNR